MNPFSLTFEYLSLPYASDIDALLYLPIEADIVDLEQPSRESFIYQCVVESKKLFSQIADYTQPIIWLLPAWSYQQEHMQLFTQSLQEQYNEHAQHVIFKGASGAANAIALANEQNWSHVNLIAIDATFRADKHGNYAYQGVGAALVSLLFTKAGWSQSFNELVSSIDLTKHNAFDGIFSRLSEQVEQSFDIIFTPGDGIEDENNIWLYSLEIINDKINERTRYQFPCYTYGKIGSLSGLINLYELTSNPTFVDHEHCALIISQEQGNHQSVTSYLWTGEEVVTNGK